VAEPGALSVLTYHRIGTPESGPPGMVSATPEGFASQIKWLADSGRAVTLAQVRAACSGGSPLCRGAVLVTFDDAYEDFDEYAMPVLRRHGIRPVLFVPTGFPDAPLASFWWDRLYAAILATDKPAVTGPDGGPLPLADAEARKAAYRILREHVKRLHHGAAMAFVQSVVDELSGGNIGEMVGRPARVLAWDRLRELTPAVDLAPHTRTHPRLDRLGTEELTEEVHGSLADLRAQVGEVAPVFAYPSGGVSMEAVRIVREAGLELAFTTERGRNDLATADPLRLARINVGRRTNTAIMRAQLAVPARAWTMLAGRRGELARPAPDAGRTAGERPGVAYVMSRFPKISETFILTEMLAMERAGVRVEVFPLIHEKAELVHPEAAPMVARAHFLPVLSPAIVASQLHWLRTSPRAYLGALRDVVTGTAGSVNFLFGGLAAFPKVAHAARRMQDIGVVHLHAHFATHPAIAGFIVHRLTGIPYSFTAHGSDLHVDRTMLSPKVAEAAFVATISEYNRKLIIDECGGRFGEKVQIIRAGVDTSKFAASASGAVASDDGKLRIVSVGTLHEVKGQTHLIEACRLLAADGVAVDCRFIGEGEDRAKLEEQIAKAGLGSAVTLVGAATGGEVAAELRRADVLVAPSVPTAGGKREGIPVVLMEAMSTGLPVVSSRLSGIPELVVDEVAGLLTEPGEPQQIAAALARLHADPALRARLGAQGRARVEEEFDVRRSVERLTMHIGRQRLGFADDAATGLAA
jgi:colanic acid/amylovoran biosynthesis glycosyltransferase